MEGDVFQDRFVWDKASPNHCINLVCSLEMVKVITNHRNNKAALLLLSLGKTKLPQKISTSPVLHFTVLEKFLLQKDLI